MQKQIPNSRRKARENNTALSTSERREVVNLIRSALNSTIEDKVTFVTSLGIGVDYSGTIVSFTNNLTRADVAVDGFTGNLIRPKRGSIDFTWSSDQAFSNVRCLVFQWLDASVPSPTGILQFTGSVRAPHSPLFWTNVHKIRVLYNHVHALKLRNTSGTDAKHFRAEFRGMETIQFASGSTTPQMGGIYALFITDDAAVTYPQITYVTELVFSDA